MKQAIFEGKQTTMGAGVFTHKEPGISVDTVLHTDGSGLWSDQSRSVQVVGLAVPYLDDECDFGELRVYFDTESWDTEKHGLIYTDDQFQKELRAFLKKSGFNSGQVSYSEQGMQGDNYVSLDVGKEFLDSWIKVTGIRPIDLE